MIKKPMTSIKSSPIYKCLRLYPFRRTLESICEENWLRNRLTLLRYVDEILLLMKNIHYLAQNNINLMPFIDQYQNSKQQPLFFIIKPQLPQMHSKSTPYRTLATNSRSLGSRKAGRSSSFAYREKKMSNLSEFNCQKSYSRCRSSGKKSRKKGGGVEKSMMFFDNEIGRNRKSRKVAFIPQAIKFKPNPKQPTPKMAPRKRSHLPYSNPQNKQNHPQNLPLAEPLTHNRDLLHSSQKPNKTNFMTRVSNVYDLVISRAMLPQFVEYFLGEALYAIVRRSTSSAVGDPSYDWKLDQFRSACEKIYENSCEEDLKYFMALSLPNVGRWNSRPVSTKNSSTLPINTLLTAQADSRITDSTSSGNRIQYFKSLNKRGRVPLGQQRESIDILDKLNSKLDRYLKSNYHRQQPYPQPQKQAEPTVKLRGSIFDLPLQCRPDNNCTRDNF